MAFHFLHNWEITAIENYEQPAVRQSGDEVVVLANVVIPRTKILRVCSTCKKVEVETVKGTWTMEQLKAR